MTNMTGSKLSIFLHPGTRFKFCTELRGELYCLTSSEQYFSYFQDENKFNNI
jgi:hypothetical protein